MSCYTIINVSFKKSDEVNVSIVVLQGLIALRNAISYLVLLTDW